MEILKVSNNQPYFKGYVDKSVSKYVQRAIENECSIQLKQGTLDTSKVDELEDYGNKILKNLSQYISKTDKNTKFTLENVDIVNYPQFKNPISSHIVKIYSSTKDSQVHMDEFGEIAMSKIPAFNPLKNARDIDLVKLERYYNKLQNINPKEIDKAFYNAEIEKINKTPKEDLGFFAKIIKTFKKAKLENFRKKISEKD